MTFSLVTQELEVPSWRQEVLWHRRLEQPARPIHKTLTLSIMEGLPTSLLFLNPSSSFLPSSLPSLAAGFYVITVQPSLHIFSI